MLGSCSTSSFTPCQAPQQRKKGISSEKQFGVLKPSSFKRKQIVSRLGRDSNGFISETGGSGRRADNLKKERTKMVPIEEAFVRGVPNENDIKINVIVPNDTITNGYSNGAARRGQTTTAMVPVSLLARDRPAIDTNEAISRGSLLQFNNLDDGLNILPSDEGFSWSKENYNRVQRTIDIWTFVSLLRARIFLIDSKWTYPTGYNEEKQKARRRKTAEWVRESILQLGPTFIKLGQLSSTRSDLFPVEFVEELSKLQDRVPAFSPEKAQSFIERELGDSVDALFKEFEKRPIAAASLGQVHRAVLPNGERVVIKVQRPGLKELFDIDLSNLKIIAEYFQNSESLGGPTRDWLGIYEECATTLYQEIDYINEGRNADRFRSDFRNNKWVRVPAVFWDYTSRKVITLQYLPGIKINDIVSLDGGSFDRALIAKRAIEAYLIQILRTGFFHADPHPGNLAVDKDGSLIYYDFGMMGEIKSFTREKLLELFYAVYEKDANKVLNGLIELGALQPTGDLGSVRRSVQFFLDNLMNQKPDENATLSAIGEDLFAIAVDQPFRFPSTFVFVLRAFTTLEGIGNILDPNFSFTNVAAPYAQELLDTRESKRNRQYVVQEIQRQVSEARDAAVSMPQRIQRMENFIKQLETGDFKLRVRVLENERAARKASILQFSTLNAIGAAALLNAGVTLFTQELPDFAAASFLGAGVFAIFVILGLRRVSRLDKFEGRIK